MRLKKMMGKKASEELPHHGEEGGSSTRSNPAPKEPTQQSVTTQEGWDEFRLSAKKLELPAFDGTDPVAWITRAKTYFEAQRTSEEVKLQLAKLSMEGATIYWYNLWKELTVTITRENLKEAMMLRPAAGRLENPRRVERVASDGKYGGLHRGFRAFLFPVWSFVEEPVLRVFHWWSSTRSQESVEDA